MTSGQNQRLPMRKGPVRCSSQPPAGTPPTQSGKVATGPQWTKGHFRLSGHPPLASSCAAFCWNVCSKAFRARIGWRFLNTGQTFSGWSVCPAYVNARSGTTAPGWRGLVCRRSVCSDDVAQSRCEKPWKEKTPTVKSLSSVLKDSCVWVD